MRFSMAVVSLLIPLISLTSSLNSTINNNFTRSNGNSPITTGEIDYSLTDIPQNDTQSTATLDPSSDFALPPPQIDSRTQFEESSLVQNESVPIDSTSSQFGHANRSRDKASSLNESAPIVPSSPTSSDTLQKPPLPLGSSAPNETLPGQTNENEDLSLNELKTQWDLAEAAVTEWQTKVESANETLNKKVDEAVEPNRLFEEMKRKWEELEAKAQDSKEREAKAKDAATEFDLANKTLDGLKEKLAQAVQALADSPKNIEEARKELARIERVPTTLAETTERKKNKADGKPALETLVDGLTKDKKKKEELWNAAVTSAKHAQTKYHNANCLLPAKNTTQSCKTKLGQVNDRNKDVRTTKTAYDIALAALEAPAKELEEFDDKLDELKKEIEELEKMNRNLNAFKTIANAEITRLEGLVPSLRTAVGTANDKKTRAEEDLAKKAEAKTKADEQVRELPADGRTASEAAEDAKYDMNVAKSNKQSIDGQVTELRNELAKATESYMKVKAAAASWKNRYETAERKQRDAEASRSASTAAMIGGVVGGVFAAVVIVAILVVCFLKKLCCFKKLKKGGPPAPKPDDNKIKSGTPSTAKSKDQPSKRLVPGSNPASGRQLRVVPAGTQPLGPDEIPSTPIPPPTPTGPQEPPGLPDLRTTPFVPGEEPFKIPAKHFKWKGPMRRRTRWHGEPKHDFENDQGVSHIDKIWFDPNANFATEIGQSEIMEDGGPPSDSNRSEWLNNLDEWEAGHAAMLREQQQQQPAAGSAPAAAAPPLPPAPLPSLRFGRHTRLEAPSTPQGARTARVTDRVRDFRRNEIKVQTPPTSKNKQHK